MATAQRSGNRTGFTLVELLVVIGIIIILAGLLTPALMTAMNKAHEADTLNTIHQVELAAQAFMNDYGQFPPSTWAQFDEVFEYDSNGPVTASVPDGVYDRFGTVTGAPDEVFLPWDPTHPLNVNGDPFGPPSTSPTEDDLLLGAGNPIGVTTVNEGIEVLTACLVSQLGGPYLEPDASFLANTDGDVDLQNHVADASSWYLSPNSVGDQVFELVDYWGNPLVYFRSDQYARHDGLRYGGDTDGDGNIAGDADDYFEDPAVGPVVGDPDPVQDAAPYMSVMAILTPVYARSWSHGNFLSNQTGNFPNLNEFQLYSWGLDGQPGASQATDPTTGALLGYPNSAEPGPWPGWNGDTDNLANWSD